MRLPRRPMRGDAAAAGRGDEESRRRAGIRARGAVARPAGRPGEHHQEGQPLRPRALQPAAGPRPGEGPRELAAALGLPAPPQRIEGFDISNISGTFKVASLVSFRHGRPDRANYRRFKIKTVEGQDDFASVAEVVRRRYTRVLKESEAQQAERRKPPETHAHSRAPASPPPRTLVLLPRLPDLILIDGGKGQLGAACGELEKLGLSHIPDHRLGQGIRGNLPARREGAAAAAARQRRFEAAPARARRVAPLRQHLQRPTAPAQDLGEHPRRVPQHRRAAQGGAC